MKTSCGFSLMKQYSKAHLPVKSDDSLLVYIIYAAKKAVIPSVWSTLSSSLMFQVNRPAITPDEYKKHVQSYLRAMKPGRIQTGVRYKVGFKAALSVTLVPKLADSGLELMQTMFAKNNAQLVLTVHNLSLRPFVVQPGEPVADVMFVPLIKAGSGIVNKKRQDNDRD